MDKNNGQSSSKFQQNNSQKFLKSFTNNQNQQNIKSTASPKSQNLASIFVQSTKCKLYVIDETNFAANPTGFHSKLIEVFKSMPSKKYDSNKKIWSFPIKDYNLLLKHCDPLKPNIIVEGIPKKVLDLFAKPRENLDESCLQSIEPKLVDSLLPFQKEGVCFGISKFGRVLIADEMGLGKTYQALAIADFYREDWPLLICTTASTRDSWANHIKKLLPQIALHRIKCLLNNNDYIDDVEILITSYTMLEKHIDRLEEIGFGVLIYDESHNLKNGKAKCTIAADRLAKKAKRVILTSGTPALSRPVELYSQIKMLDRSFMNFIDFTTRYCAASQTNFGWDTKGQSNLEELNVILSRKFMIRRLKADVLPQLSEKSRETITLDPSQIRLNSSINDFMTTITQCKDGRKKEEILISFYAETAKAKKHAVCNYIEKLIKEKLKFIIFAHHGVMMDAIHDRLSILNVDFIRIDGSTRSDLRTEYVKKFQEKSSCRVALLSLKACNAGITLTATDLIIFAELDWNPSTLAQAESRVHRIGQKGNVTCRYLLANRTADDIIWNMLKDKQDVLNKAGIFGENLQNAEHFAGPLNSHVIEDYFKSSVQNMFTKVGTKRKAGEVSKEDEIACKKENDKKSSEVTIEQQSKNDKKSSEITIEQQSNIDVTMENIQQEDVSALLDDDNDVFCDLDF